MKYNDNKIADILIEERKKKGWSQEKLIEKLAEKKVYVGRNTISAIESSAKHDIGKLSLELLTALAELYDCEIGYLLGEYSLKTGRNTDIQKETGLSGTAIDNLINIKKNDYYYKNDKLNYSGYTTKMDALKFCLESPLFDDFLENLSLYLDNPYDTPCHYDSEKNIFVESTEPQSPILFETDEKRIAVGKKLGYDVAGTAAYRTRHIPVSILESHAMISMENIIREWKRLFHKGKSANK